MIIVRTKNEDFYINDEMMTKAEHNKEKAEFECHVEGALLHYYEVESIIYTNGAKQVVWKDDRSEREQMIAELEELRNKKDFYNEFSAKHIELNIQLTESLYQNDRLCETNKKLRAKLSKRTIWQILRLKPIN